MFPRDAARSTSRSGVRISGFLNLLTRQGIGERAADLSRRDRDVLLVQVGRPTRLTSAGELRQPLQPPDETRQARR